MPERHPNAKVAGYECLRCGAGYPADHRIDSTGCGICRADAPSNLEVVYTAESLARRTMPTLSVDGGLAAFADYLPVEACEMVSLGEGHTPLIRANGLGARLGIDDLQIKDESRNPTWSHKDRFSAVAVSFAKRQGHRFIATASSGNAGASLAAYAARAGLNCLVVTFEGAPGPVVDQIRRYGAVVVELADKTRRWPILAEGAARFGWFVTSPFQAPVVGSHPYGIEGYKTIAYEIVARQQGRVPDWVVVPAAYGDNLRGIWRGFCDLQAAGLTDRLPKMAAAEIHGSVRDSLARPGDALVTSRPRSPTQALSIGTVQGTFQSLVSVRRSGGVAEVVADAALWQAQADLARHEGIFGELSSMASIAAAGQLRQRGVIGPEESVVCIMTASGLKDIDQRPPRPTTRHTLAGGLDEVLRRLAAEFGTGFS
ncbi:pyridoxal-phosphate dependent enzyme [Tistrella sp. BH-R2-4]|uniref:Pyridoxal-phosphate dependent enzyme n=1 Tax=Tistrella arctica TaxID=3133430 RepID=A0ABU9YPU4_9PROT